jgi:hypothetical protein
VVRSPHAEKSLLLTEAGIWLRDVRQAAGVNSNTWVGTDIEDSYFPTETPADTSYYHQSMTEPWPQLWYGTFDFVHSRMALPGVGHNPVDEVVKNLVGLVKPGGWIQMVEMEWQTWEGGPVLGEFQAALGHLFGIITNGQGVDMRERLATQLEEAGLKKVQYRIVQVPIGAKAKDEVRELSLQSMFATASFATATLQKVAPDMVDHKLTTMPTRLREELQNAGGSYNVFALWAQKPALS